jgi:ergothioneine biosynthesis protein EgtB
MAPAQALPDRRETFALRLAKARELSDRLFGLLRPAALVERPIPERHRLIFYLGHLEAFDRNLIAQAGLGIPADHEEMDRLFAFGIDPVDGALPSEPASVWPSEYEIRAYKDRVRETVDRCLEKADFEDERWDAARMFHVAIEHRLMHAETLAYAIHRLPLELKLAPPEPCSSLAAVRPEAAMIGVPAGRATLGLRRGERFGWDNEFEAHAVEVPAFKVGVFKVTNGEFLEFVRAGGYEERSLWGGTNWEWMRRSGLRHPAFWRSGSSGWVFRGMFHECPLPMDAPVWVSHAEADAYARWKGLRLPTEAEWHRVACGEPDGGERDYPWGDEAPTARHGNFDSHQWDPTPVGSHPEGRSAFGAYDTLGNGWEWTSTVFAPFHGFRVYQHYKGYSADFFDGRHFVLKGGSPRTDACMLRRSYRNWFQPHYPYVYAGFRLVQL